MTKVFISYSRKDKIFAGRFTQALQKSELETWIDWEDIPPTADWLDQIHKGIEQADAFLFLLSPDSVASKICGQEVDHAVQNGKRLIPIVARDVNPNDVHPALAKVNWVYGREQDDFDGAINKTLSAIRTDLAWVEAHRRLQVRALEWDKRRDNSLLLRGKDLREAEEQLANAGQKDPQPTDLQRQYILESRRGESRTRNVLLAISAVVMVMLVIASVIAVRQSNYATNQAGTAVAESNMRSTAEANAVSEANTRATAQANAEEQKKKAEENAKKSRTGELAAQATLLRSENPTLSHLLGVEAINLLENNRTKSTLLDSVEDRPYVTQYLWGHSGHVTSVAISPNGRMIASGSVDKTIILWDMGTRQPIGLPFTGHSDSITTLAFSPDGKTLASGSADETVIFWDIEKHKPIGKPLIGYIQAVRSVIFSPDGTILASDDESNTLFMWDVPTHKLIGEPFDGYAFVPVPPSTGGTGGGNFDIIWEGSGGHSLAFSPDGKTLASGGVYNALILWDPATRRPIDTPLETNEEVTSVAFSADGTTLASGGKDGKVILWDLTTHPWVGKPLIGHKSEVFCLAFGAGDRLLASISEDGNVILWDRSGKLLAQLPSGHSGATSLAFGLDPDYWTLVLGGYNNAVALWNVGIGLWYEELSPWGAEFFVGYGKGHLSPPDDILSIGQRIWPGSPNNVLVSRIYAAFSPNGKILAYTGPSTNLIDTTTHESIDQLPLDYRPNSVAFSPDSKIVAFGDSYGGQGGGILLRDLEKHQAIGQSFGKNVIALAFSTDGKTLISVNTDGVINFWDSATQQALGKAIETHTQLVYLEVPFGVVFSPDRNMLAYFDSGTSNIVIWNLLSGQPVGHLLTKDYPNFSFSPDGKLLASSGSDGITIWDLTTYQPIGPSFGSNVSGLAFEPDGNTLAAVDNNGITLWDITTRQRIGHAFTGHFNPALGAVVFSPDGKMLVSTGNVDLIFWNMDSLVWVEKTCQRAGRNLTYNEWIQYFSEEPYHKTCPSYPVHSTVIDHFLEPGDQSARSGKIEEAIIQYQEVANILPEIKDSISDLRIRAVYKYAESLVKEGNEAVRAGNIPSALDKYGAALKFDPDILGTETPISRAKLEIVAVIIQLDTYDSRNQMVLTFIKAQADYPDILESLNDPDVLNSVCWQGNIRGYASEVKETCEKAVELRPDVEEYTDHRGLNRALRGDFEGAIKDFEFAMAWFTNPNHLYVDSAKEREKWLAMLRVGQNPFDQQTLDSWK